MDKLKIIGGTSSASVSLTKNNKYKNIAFTASVTNCKFGTFERLTDLGSSKEKQEIFDLALKHYRYLTFGCHVTRKDAVDYLIKKYRVLSCVQIPIGYDPGNQYHIVLLNPYSNNNVPHYTKRIEKEGVHPYKGTDLSKSMTIGGETKTVMEEAFTAGRKDTTYHIKQGFKNFINNLKK